MAEEMSGASRRQTLGAWLRQARVRAGKSLVQSAAVLGCSSKVLSGFESGRRSPALPQIEILADFYRVPVAYFWQSELPPEDVPPETPAADVSRQRILLRQKLIGVQLRQARQRAGKTLKEAAAELRVSRNCISKYERGEREVPLPELEALASLYQTSLEGFTLGEERRPLVATLAPASASGPLASPERAAEAAPVGLLPSASPEGPPLNHLDPELREFVTQPANALYLQVALRLSRLSVAELRTVAESLLEITY